jgi:hypothetical protein
VRDPLRGSTLGNGNKARRNLVRTISKLMFVAALAAALGAALAGCYTEVRTMPPPVPPLYEPAPEPAPDPESIDGEYSGTVLVVDEVGHHIARVLFSFADGWYRAEVESLPVLEGEYVLEEDQVILVEHGLRDGLHEWRLAPAGHFELRRTETGLTLTQHLPGRGSYREVVLSRDEERR